jgi:hypothetical protein
MSRALHRSLLLADMLPKQSRDPEGERVGLAALHEDARHLGCKDAVERLIALEELMTPRETKRALEQSQKIKAHLKPIIYSIVLQSPEKA